LCVSILNPSNPGFNLFGLPAVFQQGILVCPVEGANPWPKIIFPCDISRFLWKIGSVEGSIITSGAITGGRDGETLGDKEIDADAEKIIFSVVGLTDGEIDDD
jgi:hypothetical protein